MSELTGHVRVLAACRSPQESTPLLQATRTNSAAARAFLPGGRQASLFLHVPRAGQENSVHRKPWPRIIFPLLQHLKYTCWTGYSSAAPSYQGYKIHLFSWCSDSAMIGGR